MSLLDLRYNRPVYKNYSWLAHSDSPPRSPFWLPTKIPSHTALGSHTFPIPSYLIRPTCTHRKSRPSHPIRYVSFGNQLLKTELVAYNKTIGQIIRSRAGRQVGACVLAQAENINCALEKKYKQLCHRRRGADPRMKVATFADLAASPLGLCGTAPRPC